MMFQNKECRIASLSVQQNMGIQVCLFLVCVICVAESCQMLSCSQDEIIVRFPFRLEGLQPENCGYPGFNLSCNGKGKTVLKLPQSGEFLVRSVNYVKQEVELYDPGDSMAMKLLSFTLLGSPFMATNYENFTFLSCPADFAPSSIYPIVCLSNSTNSVFATTSGSLVEVMSGVCQIIATRTVPVPWPHYDGFTTSLNEDILLTWDSPECFECEIQGGLCGFSGNSSTEIGCSSNPGKPNEGVRIFKIICLTIAAPAMLLVAGVGTYAYASDRVGVDITAVAVEPACGAVGLDESTIESYEKFVVGESKRFNDSSCAICLSEYKSKDIVRCFPQCNHCFHADCIDQWLRLKGTCPVCRNLPSPPPQSV